MIYLYEGINVEGNGGQNPSATFTSGAYELPDAISCTVTEERNGQFSLVLQYHIGGLYWEKIIPDAVIMATPRPDAGVEPFRIYEIRQVLDGIVTARANHLVYDLDGLNIASPANAFSGKQGITAVLNQLTSSGQFVMRCFELANDGITDTTTELDFGTTKYCSIWKTIGIVAAAFNAEMKYTWNATTNRCTITFCAARGTAKQTQIAYGVNISRLDRKLVYSGLYSRVVLVWFGQNNSFVQGYANTGYTGRVRSLWIDVSDQYESMPTQPELNDAAQAYVDSHDFTPLSDLAVEFIPMDSIARNLPNLPAIRESTPYLLRDSGGSANLGERNAEYDTLVGGTVSWNQLASLNTADWETVRSTVSVNDTTISVTTTSASSLKYAQFELKQDHVYFVRGKLLPPQATSLAVGVYSGNSSAYSERILTLADTPLEISAIWKNTYSTGRFRITHTTSTPSGVTGSVENLNVVDLTEMFGSAIADYVLSLENNTAGSGVAWLQSCGFFSRSYYQYSVPTLQSVNVERHIMRDANDNIVGSYALDASKRLRGIMKLDANNNLVYDGDVYKSDGTITKYYDVRSFESGDATDGSTMITNGTYTVYKLVTPTTITVDPFTNPQKVDADGTEQYVDAAYTNGTRDVEIPVGHYTKYIVYDFGAVSSLLYLCDTATVDASLVGVHATAKCTKTVYNVVTEKYDSVTVGTVSSDIVDTILKLEG